MVFASGVAFGDVGSNSPFQATTQTLNAVSQVVVYGLGAVIMTLAASPFVIGAIMGSKAYKHTKQEQDGNPTTAGVKAFLIWFIPVRLAAFAAYYFLGQILGTSTLHSAIQAICKGLLQLIKIL
ncbi:MAG: hypothetical protein QXZ59_02525 [Nitrososphaeria archaeon]